jgi:hypothetical protein
MQNAASPSGSSSFLTMFCDRFRVHMSQLADDQDAIFVRACTYRHSPFRSFVQNAIGPEEKLSDNLVSKVAHSPDLAAIRNDVVGLVRCMANEQLIDLLCTAVPHFKQLWLSAQASSFEARQRLLREVDELTFETTLNLMAERSRFRLIALECFDRYETNLELRQNLWKRSKQAINYLLGKPDAKSATAAGLQLKLLITIFVGGSAAVGAGVHYHIVNRFRPAPQVVTVTAPAPATNTPVPATAPATVASTAAVPSRPTQTLKTSPVDAHKQAAPAKTADGQKHNAPPHATKKDNHVPAKDAPKVAETAKSDNPQKRGIKGIFSFVTGSHAKTTETEKETAAPANSTDSQTNAATQTNADTKKKKGFLGFLKKNKDKDKTNNDKTKNGETEINKTSTDASH